jgi:hypothetical protein
MKISLMGGPNPLRFAADGLDYSLTARVRTQRRLARYQFFRMQYDSLARAGDLEYETASSYVARTTGGAGEGAACKPVSFYPDCGGWYSLGLSCIGSTRAGLYAPG